MVALFLFFEGKTSALAPFSYVVKYNHLIRNIFVKDN